MSNNLFTNLFAGKPQEVGPKLTKGQRELEAFRQFKADQIKAQVDADAAAGGKALRQFNKKATSTNRFAGKALSDLPLIKSGGVLSKVGTGLGVFGRGVGIFDLLNPASTVEQRMLGGIGAVNPQLGTTLGVGALLGKYMKNNMPESDFVSGRGSGALALAGKDQRLKDQRAKGAKGAKDEPTVDENRFADLRGSITPMSMQPAATNLGEGAAMDAAERFRAGAGFPEGVIRPDDYPTLLKLPQNDDGGSGNSQLNDRGPSAAELFNKYKNQGLDDETAREKAKDEGMRIWANKYKDTLAKEVKEGQAGYNVIQDTLYPNTEEGFANPNRPGVVEMIDGQKLQEPMSINQLNAVLDVRDFNMKPTSVMSVLAQKDPQKALNEFMTANNLVGNFTTASEPIVGSFPQKEYPLMTENYFGFEEYPLMTENYFGFGEYPLMTENYFGFGKK